MMADFPEPRTRSGQDRAALTGAGAWGMQEIPPRTGRGLINQAKGAVMLRHGVGSPVALALLVRWSRRSGSNLEGAAEALVSELRGVSPNEHSATALARWLDVELDGALPDDGWPEGSS